ncbi:hypothetical protein FRC02_005582 [Tulasnella sp. 418]|nr:hypothetical protein FRC02_005582 [Tulasnella sp. 418]
MPANPRIFGRQSYIDKAVLLLLSAGSTRLVILGAGGMGKTSVALKIVYDPRVIKRFGKNRIWLPCEQATSLALLTELLAKSLGLPPSTTTDRFGEVVAALEESDTYYFILLDNFETPWDIEGEQSGVANVLARLASIPTVSFIVTMRGIQHPASNLVDWTSPRLPPLTPLEMDPAQEAFLKISPESEGDPRLPELLRELDCVPLAITLMAKLAEVGETISELLSQWKLEQIKLLSQPGGDRGSSIEVSIRLSLMSLSVRNNADAVPLLSILARLPGGASLSLLSTICPSIPGWKTAMRVLRTAALVYDSPDKTVVHMLSPIRSYVLLHHPLLPAPLQHLRDAYFALADKGRAYFGEDNFHDAVLELSKEETNLDTIILDSLHDEESKQDAIAAAIQYSNYLTHTQPRNNIATAAIQVARETGSANLATCLECYGDLLRFQSQVVAADLALKEARLLFIQQGDELRAAYCQWKIGDNLRLQNELEDAVSTLEEAKVNFTKLHHLVGVGDCLWVLGQIFGMQGELEKAQSTLEEAKSLFVELRGHMGIASCLRSLGRIHYDLGQYEAAASATEEAKTTYIKLGSPFDIAECLRVLSDIYCEQGRYSEAHLVAEAARSEFARLGSKLGLGRTLQSTGYIFYKQGRYNEAFSFVENAKNELAKIGGFLDIATIEQLQGNVYRMQGKYDAACSFLEVAKSLFMKRRSRSNLIGIADCNLSLGKTFRLQAQYDKAIELLEDALATYSTQNHKKSQAAECAEEIELALKERDDCELAN